MKNHIKPIHYLDERTGIRCDDICKEMSMFDGNCFKYLFRHESKGTPTQDLEKAIESLRIADTASVHYKAGYKVAVLIAQLFHKPFMKDFYNWYFCIDGGTKEILVTEIQDEIIKRKELAK